MIARDDNTAARPTALGRGLDTLMGERDVQGGTEKKGARGTDNGRAQEAGDTDRTRETDQAEASSSVGHSDGAGFRQQDGEPSPSHPSPHGNNSQNARPPASGIAAVSGLIAGGAAGAVAIAAFALLGVRAVLSMQRRNRLF